MFEYWAIPSTAEEEIELSWGGKSTNIFALSLPSFLEFSHPLESAGTRTLSKFETLLRAFELSKDKLTFNQLSGFQSKVKCVQVESRNPDQAYNTKLVKIERLIQAAIPQRTIPANGPLFPAQVIQGQSAYYQDKFIFLGREPKYLEFSQAETFDAFENIETERESIIILKKNSYFSYGDFGNDLKTIIRYDASKDFLTFKINKIASGEDLAVGYCYLP